MHRRKLSTVRRPNNRLSLTRSFAMESTTFIVFCVIFATVVHSGNIPSFIHICKRSDPNVAKCVRESVEFIRPHLRTGIKELGVPPLHPLHIPDIVISRGNDASNYHAILKKIDVHGVSDFQLTKLKLDVKNLVFRIGVALPNLKLVGLYDINARILVVPIKGEGEFYANATNCVGNAVLRGELHDVKGEKRLRFTNLDLKLIIGDYKIKLENLFNGDPVLSQSVNDVLNDNRKEFIVVATPFIQQTVSEIVLEIANKIVKNFAFDEVFPEF